MQAGRVILYDTTLRDGTQGQGISFSLLDKLRIAEKLAQFGMGIIEAGWPGSNIKDLDVFREVRRRSWGRTKIAAFGSTRRANLEISKDPQIQMLRDAETPVVTFFGKSWKLHVTEVLGTTPEENRAMITDTVSYFKQLNREVIYDAEHFFDGYKDDPDHALGTLDAARDADVLVLCDTNGGTLPHEVEEIVYKVNELFPNKIGIHTHNDCELGVANALAAVRAGAVQVQGTINGYGERTGNCNLTSLIANLQLKLGIPVVEKLAELREVSLFVDELANCPPNIRAPFVGATAFTHKGGMHVNAVQKLARSYEHIEPCSVGNEQNILVSELSGQSNVLLKTERMGIHLQRGSREVIEILKQLKDYEARGYEFEAADASFELLVRGILGQRRALFDLKEYHCSFRRMSVGNNCACEATVKLSVDGIFEYTVDEGDGPVDALDKALRKALRPFYPWIDCIRLADYKVRILDGLRGSAAGTRVLIVSTNGHRTWGTVGVSDNIIEASWLALVDSFEFYGLHGMSGPST
jgi:2-isopropylmalate synthase